VNKIYVREADDAARSRAAAFAGGGVVLALLAGLAWVAIREPEPTADASARAKPATPAATQAMKGGAVVAASSVPVPLPLPPGQVEVCGTGILSEAAWNRPARRDLFQASVRAVRLRTIAALKMNPDPLARGLALAMESRAGEGAVDETVKCSGPNCLGAPAAAAQRRATAHNAPREALARLALTSQSPELYGLAWRVCSTDGAQDGASVCRMLSAEQWARLDPDNAVPWASVLDRARLREDGAAESDALYRMSLSRTVDGRAGRLPGLVMANVPAGTPPLETEALVAEVAAQEGEGWTQKVSALGTEACTAAAARDPERLQRCGALAETLWNHGRKPLDLTTAVRIGKAIGWPAERLQPMQDEAGALFQALSQALGGPSRSCDAVRRRISQYDESGRLGEVASARRIIAASGKPMAHWVALAKSSRREVTRGELAASAVPLLAQASPPVAAP